MEERTLFDNSLVELIYIRGLDEFSTVFLQSSKPVSDTWAENQLSDLEGCKPWTHLMRDSRMGSSAEVRWEYIAN